MFNRQPFNRGKFNVQSGGSITVSGIASLKLSSNLVVSNTIISTPFTSSKMILSSNATINAVKYASFIGNIKTGANANGVKVFSVSAEPQAIKITTSAIQSVSGEAIINLKDVVLKPGEELIINTCDMTVTINGQNAMQYFAVESDFFNLLSGDNTLIYSDKSANRNINFDVIWKDRWL